MLLLVRHLLLEAMHLFLVASLLLVGQEPLVASFVILNVVQSVLNSRSTKKTVINPQIRLTCQILSPLAASFAHRRTQDRSHSGPDGSSPLPLIHVMNRQFLDITQKRFKNKRKRTLLGAPGIAARSKNASRGSWP